MKNLVWSELRPVGDVNATYISAADYQLQYILTNCNYYAGKPVFVSTDFGLSWTQVTPGGISDFTATALGVSGDGKYMYAATVSQLFRSDDYGVSWSEIDVDVTIDLAYRFAKVSADGSHVVVGTYKAPVSADYHVLYTSADYGVTWTKRFPDTSGNTQSGAQGVAINGSGSHIYVSLDDPDIPSTKIRIYKSSNYGLTWSYYEGSKSLSHIEKLKCNYLGNVVIAAWRDGLRSRILASQDYAVTFSEKCNGMDCVNGTLGTIVGFGCDSDGYTYMVGISGADATKSGLLYSTDFGNMAYETNPSGSKTQDWDEPHVSLDGNNFLASGNNGNRLWRGTFVSGNVNYIWWD